MSKEKLIEELEDLATFLTLSASDSRKKSNDAANLGDTTHCTFNRGKELAYKTAFTKIDKIITEAKK